MTEVIIYGNPLEALFWNSDLPIYLLLALILVLIFIKIGGKK